MSFVLRPSWRSPWSRFLICLVLFSLHAYAASLDPSKPNIILIITDDQDVRTGTLDYMPKLHASIAEQGVTFTHFYAPVSLCCPSRVSLLKGQYAHNHNVTYVSTPYGGWEVFCEKGNNSEYLPIFLQEAGYGTYYTGKLMNGMQVDNIQQLPAAGWTNADFLVDPNTYLFYNSSFSANGEAAINHEGTYQMDLIVQKSTAMFQQALSSSQPFFLGIAPTAPHMEVQLNGSFTEPIPPPEYAEAFNETLVPRVPNYNVPVGGPGGGVSWLKELEALNETVLNYIDHVCRQRLRTLQTVDDLVKNIVQQVEDAGIANNTYIIYVADNGYALGSHRRQPSKTLPFQEDVLIPLLVRGPGIAPNITNAADVYSMPDLGATILDLAGATANYTLDGRPISFATPAFDNGTQTTMGVNSTAPTEDPRHTITEYWNIGILEGIYANRVFQNQTYRSLRVNDDDDEWVYGVWCTGERELFNLKTDPYQLTNLAINSKSTFSFGTVNNTDYTTIAARLDALLLVLRRCSGSSCLSPWSSIFPNGEAQDLSGALSAEYDDYFDGLEKFRYEECKIGFFEDLEGPEWSEALAYGE